MSFIADRKNQKYASLREKVDRLKEQVAQIEADLKYDEGLLDLFEKYRWDIGLEKLMIPRIRYLAAAAIELKPDDRDNLISIRGQYEEAKKLSRSKDELIQSINEKLSLLEHSGAELSGAMMQLDKMKE